MGKTFEETSHQRKYTNKHWKRCPKSLVIREILIKTTVKYYSTCTKMAIIKKDNYNKCWQGYGESETVIHFWCGYIKMV